MATNLFEYYDRVRSNTISDMGKASDVAAKLVESSVQSAGNSIDMMREKVYVDQNVNDPITNLSLAVATYNPESWKANNGELNEATLNTDSTKNLINSLGIVQYATGNNTFITNIKADGLNDDGETQFRIELGEIEAGIERPNVRIRALDPKKADDQGDLVLTAGQLNTLFEDYQRNISIRRNPILGTQEAFDYGTLSMDPRTGESTVQVTTTNRPDLTNMGGLSGDPTKDNLQYTNNAENAAEIFSYIEQAGLGRSGAKSAVDELLSGTPEEINNRLRTLTDSQILNLEAEYGQIIVNADLGGSRNLLNEIDAARTTAKNVLNNPDLNLTENEKKEQRQIIAQANQREKRVQGEVDSLLSGGALAALGAVQRREEKARLKTEKELDRDPQLNRDGRVLEKLEINFANAPDGVHKNQLETRINELKTKIQKRKDALDPDKIIAATTDEVKAQIAKVLENPESYQGGISKLSDYLVAEGYEMSNETRADIDNFIQSKYVSTTNPDGSQNVVVPLVDGVQVNSKGQVSGVSGTGAGDRVSSNTAVNRAFNIFKALERTASPGLGKEDFSILLETIRHTKTLDVEQYKAFQESKKNASTNVHNARVRYAQDWGTNAQPKIFNLIRTAEKYLKTRELEDFTVGEDNTGFFTAYSEVMLEPTVQQFYQSLGPNGKVPPIFQPYANQLNALQTKSLQVVATEANEPDWLEWFFGAGSLSNPLADDPIDPTDFFVKPIYSTGRSDYKYSDLYTDNGKRKIKIAGEPVKISAFQLQTLGGENVGGEIDYGDLVNALQNLEAVGLNPRSFINQLEKRALITLRN